MNRPWGKLPPPNSTPLSHYFSLSPSQTEQCVPLRERERGSEGEMRMAGVLRTDWHTGLGGNHWVTLTRQVGLPLGNLGSISNPIIGGCSFAALLAGLRSSTLQSYNEKIEKRRGKILPVSKIHTWKKFLMNKPWGTLPPQNLTPLDCKVNYDCETKYMCMYDWV